MQDNQNFSGENNRRFFVRLSKVEKSRTDKYNRSKTARGNENAYNFERSTARRNNFCGD